MFIRSSDKPNADSKFKNSPQQPYSKYFVLDFEATCDNGTHLLKPQEIIEFPCILVEYTVANRSFKITSCFHSYVKPKIHTELTEYCTFLTGITQEMINDSPLFDEVFTNFRIWYNYHTNNGKDMSTIVTSGNWDVGNIFVEQCALFPVTSKIPEFMYTWINIKKLYALTMGHYPYGIRNMLKTSNLKPVGTIHNGIDDCVNIIHIMNHLAQNGCVFKTTNKLIRI